jgi:UDP-N-acetylmuramate dehydrogenase
MKGKELDLKKDFSLKSYNTFGIDVKAAWFAEIDSTEQLQSLLTDPFYQGLPKLVLGGGSNILFTGDFAGLVIKNNIKGIKVIAEDDDCVTIRTGSGEIWHDLVLYSIEKGYGGIENLSLIPGTVGAAPMQNIGAYGVEIREVFESLEAVSLLTGATETFNNEECRFAYRNSIFKNELKGRFIITSVTLKLSKKPAYNISYGAIQTTLAAMKVTELSLKAVSEAVCSIRRSKLPDPAVIGNAGSFFKNPEIEEVLFLKLKGEYPDIVSYRTVPGKVKVPAGWLIEKCGWKGKVFGNTGVHKDQALVLVNYGAARGEEIKELAIQVRQSVMDKFGIELETEVNII